MLDEFQCFVGIYGSFDLKTVFGENPIQEK